MKTASADFGKAINRSHTAVTNGDSWLAGVRTFANLPITEGTITLTADNLVRGSADLRIADEGMDLLPLLSSDPLAPYGQEINLRRGVALGLGNETLSLGWFRINSAHTLSRWRWNDRLQRFDMTATDTQLTTEDRMATARDFRFTSPYQPSGSVLGCIRSLVTACGLNVGAWPGITDATVSGAAVFDTERLDALSDLAARVNAQLFVDGDGIVQVKPLPSLDTPQFVYRLGTDSTLLAVDLTVTREGVYNAVIAKGEQVEGQAPLLAIATEISGATAWGGPFGRVPLFYASSLMTTQNAVDGAAKTRLQSLISGRDLEMTIEVVPDPRMEPNDVVQLALPQATYTGRVKSLTIPLGPGGGPMKVTLRLMSDRTVVNYRTGN
jgi:hypothetical protein